MTGVYANFESFEGTTTGAEQTFTFKFRSRKIVVTNDHPTNSLSFKFNASETNGTLLGTESLSIYHWTKQIIINGTSVPYRIWVYG